MTLETEIIAAAEVVAASQRLVVSTGAGVSKESGVPTFRDAQTGLWAQYDPQRLATPGAFKADPNLVWSWYMFRREMVEAVSPNAGHYALAELEKLLPSLVLITQNIDSLHRMAGSRDIVELHGDIRRYKCFDDCRGNPTIIDLNAIPHDKETAPPCPHCGGLVRPDVVWFGEMLPAGALERAVRVSQTCDVMLVVGTSGLVQPAASLPAHARMGGATVIEVNPEPSGITHVAHHFLQGPSGEVLPRLVEAVAAAKA